MIRTISVCGILSVIAVAAIYISVSQDVADKTATHKISNENLISLDFPHRLLSGQITESVVVFRNDLNEKLLLSITSSCTCTSAALSADEIYPGEDVRVQATVDTSQIPEGIGSRDVSVLLTAKGAESSKEYRVMLSDTVAIDPFVSGEIMPTVLRVDPTDDIASYTASLFLENKSDVAARVLLEERDDLWFEFGQTAGRFEVILGPQSYHSVPLKLFINRIPEFPFRGEIVWSTSSDAIDGSLTQSAGIVLLEPQLAKSVPPSVLISRWAHRSNVVSKKIRLLGVDGKGIDCDDFEVLSENHMKVIHHSDGVYEIIVDIDNWASRDAAVKFNIEGQPRPVVVPVVVITE